MSSGTATLRTTAPLAARQHGVLSGRQLRAAGATRDAIKHLTRTGAIVRAARSVYTVSGAPHTWEQRLWVALLDRSSSVRDDDVVVVARRSAMALRRVSGFSAGEVDLLVHERRNRDETTERRTLSDCRSTSWLPPHHIVVVRGLPTTSLARTIFDLAGLSTDSRRRRGLPYVHPRRVERALDTALGRGLALADVADVVATLGTRGRPGTALMRDLLAARGTGYVATDSELEDLVLSVLRAHGVPLPEPQVSLGTDTHVIGRVDFVYRPERLILEADSRRHHTALTDWANDRRRDAELAATGWRVIRVAWDDLTQRPEAFAALVRQALRAATAA